MIDIVLGDYTKLWPLLQTSDIAKLHRREQR